MNGPVSLQAHDGKLKVFADQSMRVLSINASIEIQANQRITLYAGGSSITLDGANITFACPGTFSVKGSNHAFVEPASAPAKLPSLPTGKVGEMPRWIELNYHYDDLEPVKNAAYRVVFEDGGSRSGTLDENGFARLEGVPPGRYSVFYGEDTRDLIPPALPANTFTGNAQTPQQAFDNISRYLEASEKLKQQGTPEQREYLALLREADDDLSELAAWLPPDLANGLKQDGEA